MSTTLVQAYPPVQVPLLGSNGLLNPVWAKWFQQSYVQSGGSSSTTLTSLIATVAIQATEISTLQTENTALQKQVNGLSCGRQL